MWYVTKNTDKRPQQFELYKSTGHLFKVALFSVQMSPLVLDSFFLLSCSEVTVTQTVSYCEKVCLIDLLDTDGWNLMLTSDQLWNVYFKIQSVLFRARMKGWNDNGLENLLQCLYEHVTIVLRQTSKIVNLYFKRASSKHLLLLSFYSHAMSVQDE